MGTVTVFTADRMLAIENGTVVDGDVVGDNLILTTKDGTPIDAGNVRGPQGDTGATGNTGAAGADAAFKVRASDPTANLTLSGTQTIDGVALVVGDRVLAKNQTSLQDNGIWVVASGAWTRATDADSSTEIAGAIVLVQEGTQHGGTRWVTSFKKTDTFGSTAMAWKRDLDGFNASIITVSGTTDASGFLTVTHGLGWTPTAIFGMNGSPNSNFPVLWGVDTIGSTTFRCRFFNASSAGAAVSIATGSQKFLCLR